MEPKKVSKKLLSRLPAYLNYLKALPEHTADISATRIAHDLNLGDVLVRKDLAKVSHGGRRKLGYIRETLIRDIEEYLDMNSATDAIVVGAGKLGQALLDYCGFEASGLNVLAGFDTMPSRKRTAAGKPIYPISRLESFCQDNHVRIAILTVPAEYAQTACDHVVSCGVEAIWNFAPIRLNVPESVVVQSENLAVSLTALRVQLKNRDNSG